jgi:hypothetical protein
MSEDFFNQSFSPNGGSATGTGTGSSNSMTTNSGSTLKSRRPPPPPPPPAATSNTNSRRNVHASSGYYGNTSASASVSSSASHHSNSAGSLSAMNSNTYSNKRPTGNYYTTTTTAASAAPPPAFPAYNPYGAVSSAAGNNATASASASAAPSPYGTSSFTTNANANVDSNRSAGVHAVPSNDDNDDWFSAAQSDNPATTTMDMNQAPTQHGLSSNTSHNPTNQNMNPFHNAPAAASSATTAAPTYMNPYATTNTTTDDDNAFSGSMSSTNTTGGTTNSTTSPQFIDYENEPPLLEELGINISHIRTKSLAVALPFRYAKTVIDTSIMEDNDLAGPLVFGLLLGTELTLAGRIQYGYIYGFGLFGTLATTLVLNLMSPSDSISVWKVLSILGYSLLPVNFLAAVNVFYRIRYMGRLGVLLAALTIGWCTLSSTRLVERGCGMRDQRFLVGYPNMLLYSAFVMLTIF